MLNVDIPDDKIALVDIQKCLNENTWGGGDSFFFSG